MADKQGTKNEVEEIKEPTQQKEEPTEKTRTEVEYQKAVSTGVSKGLESIQRQFDLQKKEADSAKSIAAQFKASDESKNAYITTLKGEMEVLAGTGEDPDLLKAYKSRIAIAEREMKATDKDLKADLKLRDANILADAAEMGTKASELIKTTGIAMSELKSCKTMEEMTIKALTYQLANPQPAEKVEQPKETTPKFKGPGVGGGSGTTLTLAQVLKMNADERFKYADEIAKIPMGYKSLGDQ